MELVQFSYLRSSAPTLAAQTTNAVCKKASKPAAKHYVSSDEVGEAMQEYEFHVSVTGWAMPSYSFATGVPKSPLQILGKQGPGHENACRNQ